MLLPLAVAQKLRLRFVQFRAVSRCCVVPACQRFAMLTRCCIVPVCQRFTLQSISYALFMLCISIADYALSAVINVVIVRTIKIACNSEGKLHAQGEESHTEQR